MKIVIEEIKNSKSDLNCKSYHVTLFDSVTGFTLTRSFDDIKFLLFYINFWFD